MSGPGNDRIRSPLDVMYAGSASGTMPREMFWGDAGTGGVKPRLTNTYIPIHHAITNTKSDAFIRRSSTMTTTIPRMMGTLNTPQPSVWSGSLVVMVTDGVPPRLCSQAITHRISLSVRPIGGLLMVGIPGLKPGTTNASG